MPGILSHSQYSKHVVLFQAFFPFNVRRHAASVPCVYTEQELLTKVSCASPYSYNSACGPSS